MFAHVHQALLGLFNVQFPENSVVQLISFADPLIAPALDAYLDLKTRPDPLIQASARRTHAYLNEGRDGLGARSEEHTSELQSLMRISYAVFCLKKKKKNKTTS